ncbi:hypothetical protein IC582_025564 [Cucumis melo]
MRCNCGARKGNPSLSPLPYLSFSHLLNNHNLRRLMRKFRRFHRNLLQM